MAERRGKGAEDRAAEFLLGLGYTIVTRRFKARHGELDLVALDGDVLVAVEVKERRVGELAPEDKVDARKIASLSAAVDEYLSKVGEAERVVRYDLVAIDRDEIRHHVDAFRPS